MNSGVSFVRRMNDGPRAEVLEDVWFVFVHVHVFRRIIWGKMYELHDSLPFRCDCTQLSSLPWPLPHIDSNLLSSALIDRGRVKRRGWFCITYYYACFGTGFSYLIYPVLLCGNMGGGGMFQSVYFISWEESERLSLTRRKKLKPNVMTISKQYQKENIDWILYALLCKWLYSCFTNGWGFFFI